MDWKITLVFCLFQFAIIDVDASSKEAYKLIRKLFRGYSRTGPPRLYPNDTTYVKLGMHILHVNMDETNQRMNVGGIMALRWEDDHMKWNPADYTDLKMIRVPGYYLWKPDVDIYNGESSGLDPRSPSSYLMLHYNGIVAWHPSFRISTYCALDHTNYPYDKQVCPIYLGSWVYTQSELDLIPMSEKTNDSMVFIYNDSIKDPTWNLDHHTDKRLVVDYGDAGTYVEIVTELNLSRNMPLYTAVMLTPVAISALLAISMFFLPPWHNNKLLTGAVAAILLIMVTINLSWKLPPMIGTPKIVSLCRNTLIAVSSSMFCSVLVMNISKGAFGFSMDPPAFLVNLLQGVLGKVLCICGSSDGPATFGNYKRSISGDGDDRTYLSEDITLGGKLDEWKLVALATDRILLIIFSITFLITTLS